MNLREQPSETAASLGKYYNGVVVQSDQNLQNGWVHVTIGNGEGIAKGYMSTRYLAFGEDAQTVASAIPQYETTSSQWSLRAIPDDYGVELPILYTSGSSCWGSRMNGGMCALGTARDIFGIIRRLSSRYRVTIMTAIG